MFLLFLLAINLWCVKSYSVSLGLQIGPSFGNGPALSQAKSPSFLFGGEIMGGFLSLMEIGIFYEQNQLSFSQFTKLDTGVLRFFGAVARLGFGPITDFYVDGKLGLTKETGEIDSNIGVGFGIGGGYRYSFTPLFHIGPRAGYRVMRNQSTLDLTVLASFGF